MKLREIYHHKPAVRVILKERMNNIGLTYVKYKNLLKVCGDLSDWSASKLAKDTWMKD